MYRLITLTLTCILLLGCSTSRTGISTDIPVALPENVLTEGPWRLELRLKETLIPVALELYRKQDRLHVLVSNGEERIESLPVELKGDSLRFSLPLFQSEFRGVIHSSTHFSGNWHLLTRAGYFIPFEARYGHATRFAGDASLTAEAIGGKWEVAFSPGTEAAYKAIGLFEQRGNIATGTFITETGDYRFLEGNVFGNNLFLSGFDGSHAFLFEAQLDTGGRLQGRFYSGTHWQEPWTAMRNADFELSNPDSLTFLKPGYEKFSFTFPNLEGKMVSYPSATYDHKVVIVQIMGSWCANCMDETRYLTALHKRYQSQGLEIIALGFERSADFEEAARGIRTHKAHLEASYEFLVAGEAKKENAAKALPMLNHVMSYPTTIYIDKKGNVRKVHTGFYGPGTGSYYEQFTTRTEAFIEKLLAE